MASAKCKTDKYGNPKKNKDGTISFYIRAFCGEDGNGKQIIKSMVWQAPAGMRITTAQKQANEEARKFEETLKLRPISQGGKVTFSQYAAEWMEDSDHTPATVQGYNELFVRINEAIGHLALEKITEEHLKAFYRELRKPGARRSGKTATTSTMRKVRKGRKLTQEQLSKLSGVSTCTIGFAEQGKAVSIESAEKLSAALGREFTALFTVVVSSDTLSDGTIWHHHKLIKTILNDAVGAHLISYNVAAEIRKPPKRPQPDVRCLDDVQAQQFILALMDEKDIRVKTVLLMAIFTGLRRGELCGLSWQDWLEQKNVIQVRRASQYIHDKGVIETGTKTYYSTRNIQLSPFMAGILREYRQWWIAQRLRVGPAWQGDKERLFIQEDGKPIFPSTVYQWLQKFLQKSGLPKVSLHSLRHTNLTLLISQGVDIKTVQARSGHKKTATLLDTYAHFIDSAQERATQALDDVLLPARHG